jgi:hypothetical protein
MVNFKYSMFFDRKAVMRKLDRARRKVLSKFGAFVRTRARTSIKTRKKTANPGGPPSSHAGWLKRLIFFGYDQESDTVVIGPKFFKTKGQRPGKLPTELLEQGGESTTDEGEPATYRKFPYMRPALDAEQDKFPGLFTDSVK